MHPVRYDTSTPERTMTSLDRVRILIVDDNDAERMLIAVFLQQQGSRIYLAEDGLDGVEKARMVKPDLILMDTRMPGCDGLNACRLLKSDETTRDIPVIFLSAYSTTDDRIKGLRCGAADYIGKPFDFDEVRLRLTVHLQNRAPLPQIAAPRETTAPPPLDALLFQAARVHLLKSLADAPDLETLARLVGTNRRRLSAAFKACAGVSVFDYLREERMSEARTLLLNTKETIESIGLQLGFSSGANFSTAFRERFGITPTGFRQIEGGKMHSTR